MPQLTPEQDAYLREHKLAVFGTGRKDGSPQLSLVNYHFDGSDIMISVTTDRAKWKNAVRRPRVAMLIPDGRRQLTLYGEAEAIREEPGIVAGHRRLREAMGRPVEASDEEFGTELLGLHRVILRIVPERVLLND